MKQKTRFKNFRNIGISYRPQKTNQLISNKNMALVETNPRYLAWSWGRPKLI